MFRMECWNCQSFLQWSGTGYKRAAVKINSKIIKNNIKIVKTGLYPNQ